MGNTTSDSLDHSFKRLRLSESTQLPLVSPTCVSPKRKIAPDNNAGLADKLSTAAVNNTSKSSPIISWDNNMFSSSPSSSNNNNLLDRPKPTTNILTNTNVLSDDELICLVEAYALSSTQNDNISDRNKITVGEHMPAKLIHANMIEELSDDELIGFFKNTHIEK